jgi:hypothetical protein
MTNAAAPDERRNVERVGKPVAVAPLFVKFEPPFLIDNRYSGRVVSAVVKHPKPFEEIN